MRAGFVALVGRPNVGKSTLLNQIVGEKLAIMSARPQTTRERLLGVLHRPGLQIGFVDTPGLHRPGGVGRTRLNQFMVDEANAAMDGVDAIALLVELPDPPPPVRGKRRPPPEAPPRLDHATERVLTEVSALGKPVVLVLNKIDRVRDKRRMLPILQACSERGFAAMVPISAKQGTGVPALVEELTKLIPEGEPIFDEDTLTDRAERWFATEFVREQVFLLTDREVPYSVAVAIDEFLERATKKGRELTVSATISVEKEAHKRILVGHGGKMIREIGTRARHELGRLFDATVHLQLFVRVDEGWTADRAKLRDFGYEPSGR